MVYYVNVGSTYAIGIIFPIICSVVVVLRFLSRKSVKLEYGMDDWMAVVALVFTVGLGAVMIVGAATDSIGGNSAPSTAAAEFVASEKQYEMTQKLKYATLLLSVLGIGFVRLTFVLLYNRIFRYHRFVIATRALMVVIVIWMIAFWLLMFFACGSHIDANWGSEADLTKYCPHEFAKDAAMLITDTAIDLTILALPIVPTCRLHMSVGRRALVMVVFSLGILSVAASMTRMVLGIQLMEFDYGSSNKLFGIEATSDPVAIVSVTLWWTYLETGVGCFVSNLPPTVGLVRGKGKTLLQSLSWSNFSILSRGSGRSHSASSDTIETKTTSESISKSHGWVEAQLEPPARIR